MSDSFSAFNNTYTKIISTKSIIDIQKKIEEILLSYNHKPNSVLAAFDIDMTLTLPMHPALFYPAFIKYQEDHHIIMETLPNDKKELPYMFTLDIPQHLVEVETLKTVINVKEKGIKTIAFTASLTGAIDKSERLEIKRYDILKNLGLNFKESFENHPDVTFKTFDAYRGNFPVFYQGILYSNGEKGTTTKGSVLISFLKQTQFFPKAIIMVDDKKKNLEDIDISLKQYHPEIQFIGFEYQATFNYAPIDITKEDFIKFWQCLRDKAHIYNHEK